MPNSAAPYSEMLQQAITLHSQGLYDDADRLYRSVLAAEPDHADALHLSGLLAFDRGDRRRAETLIDRAIRLDPACAAYRLNLGRALEGDGRYAKAARSYQAALDREPGQQEAALRLGDCMKALHDLRREIAVYHDYLGHNPDDPRIHMRLVRALFRAGADPERQLGDAVETALGHMAPEDPRRQLAVGRLVVAEHRPVPRTCRVDDPALNLGGLFGPLPEAYGNLSPPAVRRRRDEDAPLHVLRDVVVVPPHWFALTDDGALLADPLMADANILLSERDNLVRTPNALARDGDRFLLRIATEELRIDEPVVLLGGRKSGSSFFDWFIYNLTRLAVLDAFEVDETMPVLINADPAGFQRDSLAGLGIGPDRLRPVPPDAIVRCAELWAPTVPATLDTLYAGPLAWLRERLFPDAFRARRHRAGRRIFVTRDAPLRRRFLNENEVYAELVPLGFEWTCVDSMTFEEQRATFADAELIVGPNGTCLTNVIFAPSGCGVIEIVFDQMLASSRHIQNICHAIGQPYVIARADAVETPDAAGSHDFDFTLDPKVMAGAIEQALG